VGPKIGDWPGSTSSLSGHTYIYGVHSARLLDVQNILSADTDISRQTEGYSFGDHLTSESLSVTSLSVIKTSIVLYSVPL
jgi:hypothetical protein